MADQPRPSEDDILRALAQQADLPPGDEVGACPDANMLSAFLSGSVVPAEQTRLERHLARCVACVSVVADLAGDDDLMEEPTGRPRPATAAVRSRGRAGWAFAAAAALLVAFVAWWLFGPSPPGAPVSLADAGAALRAAHPGTCADLVPLTADELEHPPVATERGGIRLFTPVGIELETRPTFRFAPQPGVASYEIRLLTDAGDAVWTSTTAETELPYPQGEPELETGKHYLWEVAFERLGRQTARTAFGVARGQAGADFLAALAAIDSDAPDAQRLLLATHLAIRRSHWSEARRLAALALEARPDGAVERATYVYVLTALGESAKSEENE